MPSQDARGVSYPGEGVTRSNGGGGVRQGVVRVVVQRPDSVVEDARCRVAVAVEHPFAPADGAHEDGPPFEPDGVLGSDEPEADVLAHVDGLLGALDDRPRGAVDDRSLRVVRIRIGDRDPPAQAPGDVGARVQLDDPAALTDREGAVGSRRRRGLLRERRRRQHEHEQEWDQEFPHLCQVCAPTLWPG